MTTPDHSSIIESDFGSFRHTHVSAVKLAAWALKQPDDRLVNFAHSTVTAVPHTLCMRETLDPNDCENCGCLMMQYMFEVLEPSLAEDARSGDSCLQVICGHQHIMKRLNFVKTEQYTFSVPLCHMMVNASGNQTFMSEIVKLRTFGEVKPYLQRFIAKISS